MHSNRNNALSKVSHHDGQHDDADYYLNKEGRLTEMKPIKNPNVHEYLYSLSKNQDQGKYKKQAQLKSN